MRQSHRAPRIRYTRQGNGLGTSADIDATGAKLTMKTARNGEIRFQGRAELREQAITADGC